MRGSSTSSARAWTPNRSRSSTTPRGTCAVPPPTGGMRCSTAPCENGDAGPVGARARPPLESTAMSTVLSAVAWPYANGPRHIGHVAGFGVPSDVFSRYMRMAGHDVLMVSGTDEHGTPILVEADKEGISARDLADRNNRLIVEDLVALGLSYDLFTRTTTRNHHQVVQDMFVTVRDNGYMIEQTTSGAISPSTGRTLPDRYIEGTCPICGPRRALGGRLRCCGAGGARRARRDTCGLQPHPSRLVAPVSRIDGETPEFVAPSQWFLALPALAAELGRWLDERDAPGLWRPNVLRFSQT